MKNRVFKWTPVVLLAVLLINFGLTSYLIKKQSQENYEFYAGLIGKIDSISPEAAEQVISQVKNGGDSEKGKVLLLQYGYSSENVLGKNQYNIMRNSIFFSLTFSGGLIFLFIGILILLDRRKIKKDAQMLGFYIDNVLQGDYDLDIRDNSEGQLSLLKNQVYKVTVKLREQSRQLQIEQENLKDTLANISHQIKTPLTSLLVMNELLMNDLTQAQKKEFVTSSQKQLERIKWLIETLLKLAKFDANTIELKREQFLLKDLVKNAIAPILIPLEVKNQKLIIQGDENAVMEGDFNWTSEAITNILKNCTEHTPEGGQLQVTYVNNPLYVQITIRDNGKGIAPKELPHIFERFYRGEKSSSNSVGIGLALAHTIMKHQNGEIKANSVLNQGTTFVITVYKSII